MKLNVKNRLLSGMVLTAVLALAACNNETPQQSSNQPASSVVSSAVSSQATASSEQKDPYANASSEQKDPYANASSEQKDPYANASSEQKDPYANASSEQKDPYANASSEQKDPYANASSEQKDPYANASSEQKDPYASASSEQKDPYANEKKEQSNVEKYNFEYKEVTDGKTKFGVVENPDGPKISFSLTSGVNILTEEVDGKTLYFKDLNSNGKLEVFEDWRNDADTRAKALAQAISIDQVAGLMLFSKHERNQADGLTDEQKTYLENDNLRNVLHAGPNNVEDSVKWTNELQAFVESLGSETAPIIPVNISSDPRSTAGSVIAYNADGDDISRWPSNLGLAATFDPEYMRDFSMNSSEEYRAMGITMALGPQIDLATEPRWLRVNGTFGEHSGLATDFAEAYINQSQSTYDDAGNDLGWGEDSISIMIKHVPGDGPGEGGRESHLFQGKYGVFPGDNFAEHLGVFTNGGLKLSGKTQQTAAMMTNYSIMLNGEGKPLFGDQYIGTAYNKEIIDMLREENNYNGVLVTDWAVTRSIEEPRSLGTAWGAEKMTPGERHFSIIKSGLDMFGGNNDKAPVLEAYELWQKAHEKGDLEQTADDRFRLSAERILKNLFLVGLFENPYLDLEVSKQTVASEEKVKAGYQAQLDSVVMVKNTKETIKNRDSKDVKEMTVYIPATIQNPFDSLFGPADQVNQPTMDVEAAKEIFKEVITDEEIVDSEGKVTGYKQPESLENVDLVIVGMVSPDNGHNFSWAGVEEDNTTYYPLSLQYRPYTADGDTVRKESISGDILDNGEKENRSYFGKSSKIANEYDLDVLLNTVALVEKSGKEIPIVVAMKANNPVVMAEFEDKVDAILVGFQVSDKAFLDIIAGVQEPKGLLPIQFPKDMSTVEANKEDVPFDLEAYVDSEGNSYDFGYGLNYKGVIKDERTERYSK